MPPASAKRKPIHTGLGVLLLVLGANGLYALFKPSPGMMRPDNHLQFAVMFLVPLGFGIGGVMIIVNGLRRQKQVGSDPG
jgi:hypothetical protein